MFFNKNTLRYACYKNNLKIYSSFICFAYE